MTPLLSERLRFFISICTISHTDVVILTSWDRKRSSCVEIEPEFYSFVEKHTKDCKNTLQEKTNKIHIQLQGVTKANKNDYISRKVMI